MSSYDHAQREVMDIGVDWITATAGTRKTFSQATATAQRLLLAERDRGNRIQRVTVEGYAGFGCGSFFAGAFNGTMLTRASSHLAAEHWREIYEHSTNVSRLDLQATIRYSPHIPQLATYIERTLVKKLSQSKSKLDVELRRSRLKGLTCYVGSRKSDCYARIYDKYLESRCEEFTACWRWELEMKRRLAQATADALAQQADPTAMISRTVSKKFQGYGVRRTWPTQSGLVCRLRKPPRPTAVASLKWLEAACSKRVGWLIEAGYLSDVIAALGLSEYVVPNPDHHREE